MSGGGNISGQNRTDATIVGGTSFNALTVTFSQSGSPSATGGAVTNSGSATSTPSLTANPSATNTTTQDQHPSLSGTTGSNSQTQDASSRLTAAIDADGPPDRVTAWAHRARGLATASLGQSAQAVADYRAYLDLTPEASDREQIEAWIAALS